MRIEIKHGYEPGIDNILLESNIIQEITPIISIGIICDESDTKGIVIVSDGKVVEIPLNYLIIEL